MNKHQKKLKEFYVDIAKWINEGTPHHPVFDRSKTLCCSLSDWLNSLPWYEKIFISKKSIQHEQLENFRRIYKEEFFPFGGHDTYVKDWLMQSHFQNERRLAYIFVHAGIERNEAQR